MLQQALLKKCTSVLPEEICRSQRHFHQSLTKTPKLKTTGALHAANTHKQKLFLTRSHNVQSVNSSSTKDEQQQNKIEILAEKIALKQLSLISDKMRIFYSSNKNLFQLAPTPKIPAENIVMTETSSEIPPYKKEIFNNMDQKQVDQTLLENNDTSTQFSELSCSSNTLNEDENTAQINYYMTQEKVDTEIVPCRQVPGSLNMHKIGPDLTSISIHATAMSTEFTPEILTTSMTLRHQKRVTEEDFSNPHNMPPTPFPKSTYPNTTSNMQCDKQVRLNACKNNKLENAAPKQLTTFQEIEKQDVKGSFATMKNIDEDEIHNKVEQPLVTNEHNGLTENSALERDTVSRAEMQETDKKEAATDRGVNTQDVNKMCIVNNSYEQQVSAVDEIQNAEKGQVVLTNKLATNADITAQDYSLIHSPEMQHYLSSTSFLPPLDLQSRSKVYKKFVADFKQLLGLKSNTNSTSQTCMSSNQGNSVNDFTSNSQATCESPVPTHSVINTKKTTSKPTRSLSNNTTHFCTNRQRADSCTHYKGYYGPSALHNGPKNPENFSTNPRASKYLAPCGLSQYVYSPTYGSLNYNLTPFYNTPQSFCPSHWYKPSQAYNISPYYNPSYYYNRSQAYYLSPSYNPSQYFYSSQNYRPSAFVPEVEYATHKTLVEQPPVQEFHGDSSSPKEARNKCTDILQNVSSSNLVHDLDTKYGKGMQIAESGKPAHEPNSNIDETSSQSPHDFSAEYQNPDMPADKQTISTASNPITKLQSPCSGNPLMSKFSAGGQLLGSSKMMPSVSKPGCGQTVPSLSGQTAPSFSDPAMSTFSITSGMSGQAVPNYSEQTQAALHVSPNNSEPVSNVPVQFRPGFARHAVFCDKEVVIPPLPAHGFVRQEMLNYLGQATLEFSVQSITDQIRYLHYNSATNTQIPEKSH